MSNAKQEINYITMKAAIVRQLRNAVAQAENGNFALAAELAELGVSMARKADAEVEA